jgi:hypothetical protein
MNVDKSDYIHLLNKVTHTNLLLYPITNQVLNLVIHLFTGNNKEEQKRDL